MKSILSKALLSSALLVSAAVSMANTNELVFHPSNRDLSDLDHYYAYSWGLNISIPDDQVITGAQLKIKNIWDWTVEDDILQVTMLDKAPNGVRSYYDNQGAGDFFGGQGIEVGNWSDPVGGKSRNFDLVFDLGELGLIDDLNKFLADGKVGFGFDPDCHYWNDGVSLTLQTAPVPEPFTMGALLLGGAAALRRRKKA